MLKGELGRNYADGEIIFKEGEKGEKMYVIQSGQVKITKVTSSGEVTVATLKEGDIFGEMALFDRLPRSANAMALGATRILSVDKKKLFTTINRDPTLVFNLLESMSRRIRSVNEELTKLRHIGSGIAEMCLDVSGTCTMVLKEAQRLVKADNGSLMLLDDSGTNLGIVAAFGIDLGEKASLREGFGIAGDVLKTGKAELINNVRADQRFLDSPIEIAALLCIPLKCEHQVFGVINLSRTAETNFSIEDLSAINSLSLYASLALQNARNFVRLKNATDGVLRHATILNEFTVPADHGEGKSSP